MHTAIGGSLHHRLDLSHDPPHDRLLEFFTPLPTNILMTNIQVSNANISLKFDNLCVLGTYCPEHGRRGAIQMSLRVLTQVTPS